MLQPFPRPKKAGGIFLSSPPAPRLYNHRMQTDQQLLTAFVTQHSNAAFSELVERHKDWIYSLCQRRLRASIGGTAGSLPEDATQAVFIALARKAPSLLNHTTLAAWLYQAARF